MNNFIKKYQSTITVILVVAQIVVAVIGIAYGNYLQSQIQSNGITLSGGSQIDHNGIGVQQNNQQ